MDVENKLEPDMNINEVIDFGTSKFEEQMTFKNFLLIDKRYSNVM